MSRQRANDEGPLTIPEPILSNKAWAKYMRGQTNRRPVNAEGVYGTHRDYRWKWVPDVNDPQHRGSWRKMTAGKRPMTVYGPVDWDSLWPDWRSVGKEFLQTGTADDPLTYEQRLVLRKQMKKSIYVIRSFAQHLASGMFGTVWRVLCQKRLCPTHGKPDACDTRFMAAVKIMRLKLKYRQENREIQITVQNMLKDFLALRYVNHENIVKYLDIIALPDTITKFPYSTVLVLMELCDCDLLKIIDLCNGPMPLDLCRKWVRDVALGVQYLHKENIVHLDIKPANILLQFTCTGTTRPALALNNIIGKDDDAITFKLGDLGTSQSVGDDNPTAQTIEFGGTPYYCAPEMLAFTRTPKAQRVPISAKLCDVYSLGASLARALIPKDVYEKHVRKGTLNNHINDIKNGQVVQPGVTPEVVSFIQKIINPQTSVRPNIDQVLNDKWLSVEKEEMVATDQKQME